MQQGPGSRRSGILNSMRSGSQEGADSSFELLEKGFQLAYFLFSNHSIAIDILGGALEKLEVQCQREKKRLFWRDKHPTQPVRRITRKDSDLLQWLIMLETEEYEKEQERTGNPSQRDMVVRYIKYLAQITTAMSSFYVNVGLTRLLHNYNTSETQYIYETLTHRYLGPDEYRRAKSALMDGINKRFSKFLRVIKAQHGELRFEACDDQERWVRVVNECLKAFTPWSTEELCSDLTTISSNTKVIRAEVGHNDADQNEREMIWCHILMDPPCYRRLLKELELDMPETRLSLPKFTIQEESSTDGRKTRDIRPVFSQEMRNALNDRLADREERRRKLRTRCISVVVDGACRAQLDPANKGRVKVDLQEGSKLIEVRADDDRGSLLLATHFISYDDNTFEFSKGTVVLKNAKLEIIVTPIASSAAGSPRATLAINCRPKFGAFRSWHVWSGQRDFWHPIMSYALTGFVAALVAWMLTAAFYKQKLVVFEQAKQQSDHSQGRQLQAEIHPFVHYLLTPDDQRIRSQETLGIPIVSFNSNAQVIILDVPVTKGREFETYSADLEAFSGDRRLMTQNSLRAISTPTATAPTVAIMVPASLLDSGKYYTVQLYSIDSTGRSSFINRFTFKTSSTNNAQRN